MANPHICGTYIKRRKIASVTDDSRILEDSDQTRLDSMEAPGSNNLCERCAWCFAKDNDRPVKSEGRGWREVSTSRQDISPRSMHCTVCGLIRNLLPGDIDEKEEVLIQYWNRCCHIRYHGAIRSAVIAKENLRNDFKIPPWMKLSKTFSLDSEMIRIWIQTCKDSHSNEAHLSRSQDPVDITLVDVVEHCLVRAQSSTPFCALSYVWGKSESLQTTTENRASFGSPGSLRHPQNWNQIARVIRDAIRLVASIGERYLWADAICIEQDNPTMKHRQIKQMDIIYSHALLTIVALSGKDSASPLFGHINDNRALTSTPATTTSVFQDFVTLETSFQCKLQDSVYNRRAWTFQERLLSQRCLFIDDRQCFFRCHSQLQTELPCISGCSTNDLDIFPNQRQDRLKYFSSTEEPRFVLRDSVAFDHYKSLLETYRTKLLSDPSDTLNAFSGILAVLARHNNWHILSGIPEEHFDRGLLWSPKDSQDVERNAAFPSWSWTGWKCPITWKPIRKIWGTHSQSLQYLESEIEDLQTFFQTPKRSVVRLVSPSSQKILQSETTIVPPVTSGPIAGIDVLSFNALSVGYERFNSDRNVDATSDYLSISLLDKEGRNCGICYGVDDKLMYSLSEYKPATQWRQKNWCTRNWGSGSISSRRPSYKEHKDLHEVELILLSRFRHDKNEWCGSDSSDFEDSDNNGVCDYSLVFDNKNYPFSESALLNVMLIQWKGDLAERLAIGLMHELAFMNANPVKKKVVLA